MVELEDAWERALGLMERASEFGRHDDQGGTSFGWYPAKPDEAPLVDARVAWLRHTIYDPLDEHELGSLERELERPLPGALRLFYTKCANGVEMLGQDVSVYGFRRGCTLDPFDLMVETSDPPADATASHVFFGSWGDDRNLLYRTGSGLTANYLDTRVPVGVEGDLPTAVEYGGQPFPVSDTPTDAVACGE